MFPISSVDRVAVNALGCSMDHNPGPIMVTLPGEVSMQMDRPKTSPMIEECPAVRATPDQHRQPQRKQPARVQDFAGGQLYLEHAGSPSSSTSVRTLIVVNGLDELPPI